MEQNQIILMLGKLFTKKIKSKKKELKGFRLIQNRIF